MGESRCAAVRLATRYESPGGGTETSTEKGDQVQWGGRTLYADGTFATPDGRPHFAAIAPLGREHRRALTPDRFRVSTRRGKQFNSMVQHEIDPLTGAARDAILISAHDAARFTLADGDRVELRSP